MTRRVPVIVAVCLSLAVSRAAVGADSPPANRYYLPPKADAPTRDVVAAQQFFTQAKQAADAGQCTRAAQLVYAALDEDPNHAAARKLLGYQKYDDHWVSDFGVVKLRVGEVWHEKFGWIKSDYVSRYEQGECLLNGKWIPIAQANALNAKLSWKIDTEHFRLTSYVDLEESVQLAERLESLYHVWRQVFARFHTPEAEWKRLCSGEEPRKLPSKRNQVVYFRTKADYVAELKRKEPRIEMSLGYYMNDNDTAYFYADPTQANEPTMFHEVVHQLFAAKISSLRPGTKANFWIVEGVACYFESLALHDDYAELGDPANVRILQARHRRIVDDFYVPLVELAAFSQQKMQQDPRIAKLYTQASGLSWFLLEADGGRYREATVDYLAAVYAGKDTEKTLVERTGRGYAELDQAYRDYLEHLPGKVMVGNPK